MRSDCTCRGGPHGGYTCPECRGRPVSRDNRLCRNDGGVGIGAGHSCSCNELEGHDGNHGCSCGATWTDPVDVGGGRIFQGIRMPSSALDHASERLGAIDDALGIGDPHAIDEEDEVQAALVVDFVSGVVRDVNPGLSIEQSDGLVHVVVHSLIRALDDPQLRPKNVLATSTWVRRIGEATNSKINGSEH